MSKFYQEDMQSKKIKELHIENYVTGRIKNI